MPFIDSAKVAYTSGDFAKAAHLYLRVAEHGYESSQLYYNIGNCYYKQMQIASAIYFYQKALKLDPSFEDAKYNLKLAQELIVDKIEAVSPPFYKRWYKSIYTALPPNTWAVLTVIFFVVFIIGMFILFSPINMVLRRIAIPISIFALIFSILIFAIASSSYNYVVNKNLGVIMEPTVFVRSTPSEEGTPLFTIHEGLTVKITNFIDGWYQIRLDDGRVGWLPQNTLEEV